MSTAGARPVPGSLVRIVGDSTDAKQVIAAAVRQAVELFLSRDLRQIEAACNSKRQKLTGLLRGRPTESSLAQCGLPGVTVGMAIDELRRPFQLADPPETVVIDLSIDRCDRDPNVDMAADPESGTIYVFATAIDPATLRTRYANQPIARSALHEMLHICGDARKEDDGIVRHNWAGMEPIRELLGL